MGCLALPQGNWTTLPGIEQLHRLPHTFRIGRGVINAIPPAFRAKLQFVFEGGRLLCSMYIYKYGPIYIIYNIYIYIYTYGTFNLWWLAWTWKGYIFIHLCWHDPPLHDAPHSYFFNMPGTIPSLWSTRKFQTQKKWSCQLGLCTELQ